MRARAALVLGGLAVALVAGWLWPRLSTPLDRFGVAMRLIGEGRGDEAAHLLDDPVWRGVAQYRAERYRRALAEFIQVESALSLYNLGNAYARLGEYAGARAAYEKALRLDPGHEDAAFNLALVIEAKTLEDALAEAERNARKLGAADPNNRQGEQTGEGEGGETVKEGEATAGELQQGEETDKAGKADTPGREGLEAKSDIAMAGPSSMDEDGAAPPKDLDGLGAALIRRESAQEAEVLLRKIRDDPDRVLRARLRAMHKIRTEGRVE